MSEKHYERNSPGEYEWQITEKVRETHDTFTFSLKPSSSSQRFNFGIGQFVTLSAMLKRPKSSGGFEENLVNRAYSIASSPTRDYIQLTIKEEKPYGYINPVTKKSDAFAAYFNQQAKIGEKIKLKLNPSKQHFMWKVDTGIEKNIAYWSGANGAQSARCLIQYMEDKKDLQLNLVLFYSNTQLSIMSDNAEASKTDHRPVESLNVIYYNWLIDAVKKLDNLKVVFTFTREEEIPVVSDDPRIIFRKGRFFLNPDGSPERTLSKYGDNIETSFNPVCGSSAFINGTVRLPDGKINKGKGILQNLIELEGIRTEKIDKEQFYLHQVGTN